MITTLIFDIGNVLTNFKWEEFIHGFGFPEETVSRIAKAAMLSKAWYDFDRGVPEEEVLQEFIDNDPGIERELRIMFQDIGGTLEIFDTTIPWLDELKEQGYRRLILSNLSEKTVRECPHALTFLWDHVDGGILSYTVGMVKPDREIYDELIARYSLVPEECVFMDDREENIATGRSVGFHGIVYRSREEALQELEKLGVKKSSI